MMRIALFLATNVAVLALASVTFRLLGLEEYFYNQGTDINLTGMLLFAAVFGMGGSFVSLLMSKWLAKMSTRAQVIDTPRNQNERWLKDTVAQLARSAGIGMPEVAVFDSPQPNAFATGASKNNALVAVSTGLLQHMREDEVRAVLAHEIGHVANGDMVTLTLIQGVMNTFVIFFARIIGSVVDRAVFKSESGHGIGFFVVTMIAQVVLGILASMVVMWFSRYREYRADAAGASLAGRNAMISALERLKAASQMPDTMPDTLTAFGIASGIKQGLAALMASHPPLDARIAALKNAA
ncbi:MAG: protease HtpX [Gammaproteobacteria bacterium]|nr:protease HtpX [Gammaproteobacteria bacterium]